MSDIAYFLLRIWVGVYFLFWGLNGFTQWVQLKPNSARFERFIDRLFRVPGLMFFVKCSEIAVGGSIASGAFVGWAMVWLLPIVLVIVASHLLLNFKKGWPVALTVLIPYLALAGLFYAQLSAS